MRIQLLTPHVKTRLAIYCRHLRNRPRESPRSISSARSNTKHLDYQALDRKWQKKWAKIGRQDPKEGSPKSYVLAMFPYPSGALHMGHLRVYTITDVIARFRRMQGCKLLYPMGWDAFGLPAENAAIERGLDPQVWTESNITKMKEQLQAMNGDIDWSREFMTCDPSFYKHTQRLFLLLYEHGLAYQAESLVNYDPIDRTVLANEQVDANGFSWRSGAKVEKLNLKQWFLKITAFKEALLNDLDWLRLWPERVISMQRNWLGRSKGANVKFDIADDSGNDAGLQSINIFTTRPDTLYGVQYLCLSANHPVVTRLCDEDPALHAFVNSLGSLPVNSKHGYQLQGIHAKSPLRHLGDVPESVLEPLPIFVSPYVVESYGEGAIMGVPAHDARDWEFWEHNSGSTLPRQVVFPRIETPEADSRQTVKVFTDPGVLSISCGRYAGLDSRDAAQLIVSDLSKIGGHAEFSQTWRLRDWLISRQRYWGTPIPIVHCPGCGAVPVPLDQLPVKLPKIESSSFKHRTGNPLGDAHEWVNTTCPKCSGPAKRDTDTMDTFMDSSWYMFRFTDPQNEREPFAPALANANMPVDVYLGGVEHAILHLLYARFIGKFLATTSLWPAGRAPNIRGEPFKQQISQGMVHGKTYSDPETGKFLRQDELDLSNLLQPKILASGKPPNVSFEKMSKSKHNGVDPSSVIAKYGADVTRAHMLFQAPVSEVLEWEEERIAGIQRWLHRLRNITQIISANLAQREPFEPSTTQPFPFPIPNLATLPTEEASLYLTTLRTVASIITSLSTTYALNTCISDLMSLTNALVRWQDNLQKLSASTLYHVPSALIRLLAPFVPAFAEECWEILHSNTRIPYPYLEGATNPNPQPKSHYSIKKSPRLSAPERAKPTPEASPEPTYPAASVFNHPFPTASATDIKTLEARTSTSEQTCAVMENGKLRFTVPIELAPEGMEGEELQEWVVAQIDKTIEGRLGLWRMREAREGRQWRRMVVVKGGRTVNFVE